MYLLDKYDGEIDAPCVQSELATQSGRQPGDPGNHAPSSRAAPAEAFYRAASIERGVRLAYD